MPLTPGTRLGPYEVVSSLGAGGMGEVYRARDTKLDRDVAIKVLPARLSESAEAFGRFEREAKAVATLSHPNILAIHDFGTHDGTPFAVMELVEGETLRLRLAGGALPARKAADYAAQIARGLAAAHEKGIVHRDLKPENVIVSPDGRVKILDFGLARQSTRLPSGDETSSPTLAHPTGEGTVMGTVGYMSPEQVRGETADHRSDVFSLGCVLYEMLTGRRAFEKPTGAETMTAILREDPVEPRGTDSELPPALERALQHCLEKSPAERFQSARDLAFDLEAAVDSTGRSTARPAVGLPSHRITFTAGLGLAAATLAVGLGAGWLLRARLGGAGTEAAPKFTRLTFEDGTVWNARFTPDGQTVAYAAAWSGEPIRLFLARLDSRQSIPLGLPDASLLSLSSSGELAVSLGHAYEGWMGQGTLARAPLLGGAARPVLEGVREADWTPDGTQLAIVRRVEGRERLEFPAGRVLYETPGYVSQIRFSPKGDKIAFVDHPLWADNVGVIAVMDLSGGKRALTAEWRGGVRGLAWGPSGDEVWFTASDGEDHVALHAVDQAGRQRSLLTAPTDVVLFDVSREGRLLLGREMPRRIVEALLAGHSTREDISILSIRENSAARFVSPDGRSIVLTDQYGVPYQAYLRHADGSPPVRMGDGDAYGLSPDERWVVALTADAAPRILLHPTGAGESRELPNERHVLLESIAWLPGGKRLVAFGPSPGERSRGWVIDAHDGTARPFTEEGVRIASARTANVAPVVSPDGTRVVGSDPEGRPRLYLLDGGASEPVPGVTAGDHILQWTDDGRALFVGHRAGPVWQVRRLDLRTGRATPWTEIAPRMTAGLRLSFVYLTPNGRFWAHSYSRLLSDLYVVEGIR